nr:aminotransferase class III-fold pyridoxal phosphate-dependent enzyme [Synechococcus sp. A18-25c]
MLSKRPSRYCSKVWPSYYVKAKGCKIKSVDNRWYRDFSEFSIGCNLLGYQNRMHNSFMPSSVFRAPLTTLLSPYEVELAELLNQFFEGDFVWKFLRGGGEALSLCIRYARSVASNPRVLVCGYHGWHDWYLSANISSPDKFESIFLPGLNTQGVPDAYSQYSQAVNAQNLADLKNACQVYDPGIIIFESARYEILGHDVAEYLNEFQRKGGILISDEVTSGFRFSTKLACRQIKLIPDFFVIGKSLGNGYAISAVAAQQKYRTTCEECFASSTHWTEQIGLAAGCATLKVLSNWNQMFKKIQQNGSAIRSSIINVLDKNKIEYKINSLTTMISFQFTHQSFSSLELKSLICSRMAHEGYLFSTTVYPSLAHTPFETKSFERVFGTVINKFSYDLTYNKHLLNKELLNIGTIENGFSRTQSL